LLADAVEEELEAAAEPLGGIGGKAVAASLFSIPSTVSFGLLCRRPRRVITGRERPVITHGREVRSGRGAG
jgi:hypothetical protein